MMPNKPFQLKRFVLLLLLCTFPARELRKSIFYTLLGMSMIIGNRKLPEKNAPKQWATTCRPCLVAAPRKHPPLGTWVLTTHVPSALVGSSQSDFIKIIKMANLANVYIASTMCQHCTHFSPQVNSLRPYEKPTQCEMSSDLAKAIQVLNCSLKFWPQGVCP